jgi:uncharacterized membrane protein YfcA
MNQLGYLSGHAFLIALGSAIPVTAIVFIGGKLRNRLSQSFYRTLVLVFLLVLGATLTVKSLI